MRILGNRRSALSASIARSVFLVQILILFSGLPVATQAAVGGSISGTVKDPTGAVIAKAVITVTNSGTSVQQTVTTNDAGAYSFPTLPVGHYNLDIAVAGFRPYRRTGITLDVNSAILVDAVLEVGRKPGSDHRRRIRCCRPRQRAPSWGTSLLPPTWRLCRSTGAAIPTCLRFSPALLPSRRLHPRRL